jgi:hypothetical protein
MKLNLNFNKRTNKPEFSEDARKAVSLLYFEEALYKEEYEECGQLAQAAKALGAEQGEITKIIAKYLKGGKSPKREAKEVSLGVRRF